MDRELTRACKWWARTAFLCAIGLLWSSAHGQSTYWSVRNAATTFDPLNGSTLGTVTGTEQYVTGGPYGQQMFDFNDTTRIDYGSTPVVTTWSMAAWVNVDSTTQQIFAGARNFAQIRNGSGGRRMQAVNFDGNFDVTAFTTVSAGIHHIVGVANGSTVKCYVDGVEVASIASGNATATGTDNRRVGANASNGDTLDGKVAEYGWWPSTVLTDAQIEELYEGPEPTNTVAPAAPTGTPEVGETLTADTGTWNAHGNGSLSYAYQWQADTLGNNSFSNIGGATSSTYVVDAAYEADQVRVVVAASNTNGGNDPAMNTASAPVLIDSGSGVTLAPILLYYMQRRNLR